MGYDVLLALGHQQQEEEEEEEEEMEKEEKKEKEEEKAPDISVMDLYSFATREQAKKVLISVTERYSPI
ncbi:hypothetical protein E2C01_064342 [Portunus trituberculatus]|uniref:Ribosomal RNA-processing protein 7 C-terminal domain-containing protein n=1 Tax=Portunus trituberculatus TaxID=210409 RepID=A0A5B7HNI1_PORTR|nr:hypothetical protein [Portunus trituberculatus]